jgi:hypothetical protein
MPVADNTVLRDFGPLDQSSYRAAVAAVVNGLKADKGLSDAELARELGCSSTTVNNASNKRGNLDAVTLLAIGDQYGVHRLDPVLGLVAGKAAPCGAQGVLDAQLPIAVARGQLWLALAMSDQLITDDEILAGASDITAGYEAFAALKSRLDELRTGRE